jgi:hypothetical protein
MGMGGHACLPEGQRNGVPLCLETNCAVRVADSQVVPCAVVCFVIYNL